MNKYIKTTKGIYELNENRRIEHDEINGTPKAILKDHSKDKRYQRTIRYVIILGEVIALSDNLNDLIEYAIDINKDTNKVSAMYPPVWLTQLLEVYRRIGVIKIDDDLVKVADWDNEKGEWKLYER